MMVDDDFMSCTFAGGLNVRWLGTCKGPWCGILIARYRSDSRMARVTVVNDYPEFLEVMESLVSGQGGHEYRGFDGTQTTFDEIARTVPEVLIIDLRLVADGMSGWDILALARSDDAMRDVPIIVCSADIAQARQRAAEFERIGNIHVREKPFDVEEMLGLIDRLAGESPQAAAVTRPALAELPGP
jgi:DNA-binding NtrC family response regulator